MVAFVPCEASGMVERRNASRIVLYLSVPSLSTDDLVNDELFYTVNSKGS